MDYRHYFSRKAWDEYSGELSDWKFRELITMIPDDTTGILDVGCGSGQITNRLAERWRVCGVDFSPAALESVTGEKVCASCDALPAGDRSWDLLLSSELLEHLDTPMLRRTIDEFRRVADRYILISVPDRETLSRRLMHCPKCGCVFHAHGHVQSLSAPILTALMAPDFSPVRVEHGGPPTREGSAWLVSLRQQYAGRWFDPGAWRQCPKCGADEFPKQRGNLLSKTFNLADRVGTRKRPYWLYVLFRRDTP
jgi:SAM-dependent methyltransferase